MPILSYVYPEEFMGLDSSPGKNICLMRFTKATIQENYSFCPTQHILGYVISGKKRLTIGKKSEDVTAGHYFLICKGQYVQSEFLCEEEPYQSLTFFFTRDIAEYLTNVLQEILEPLITGKISLKRKLIIVNQPDPDIVASFEALNKFSHKDSAYLRRVTKLRLVELFYLLLGTVYKKDVIAYLLDAAHNDVPSISLTVEEQLYNPVSVEKLAELSGRSLSCFKREFQQIYGMSPHRWLRTKRLEHAAWLLSTTTRLVEEVADACGFASTTHFTRAFKEKFGLSPRDYRTKQIEFPTL